MKILGKAIGLLFTTDQIEKREQAGFKKEPEFDWQYLVTPGHATFARMNHLSFVGTRLILLFIASCALSYYAVSISAELVKAASTHQAIQSEHRPEIYSELIIKQSREFEGAFNGKVTPTNELPAFIKQNIDSLSKNNALSIPCNSSSKILSAWLGKNNSIEYPMCLVRSASKTAPARVYTFAIVKDGSQFKNWLGVFFKKDGKWIYKNVGLPNFHSVYGNESFAGSDIVNTLKADFPDLPLMPNQSNTKSEIDYE